MNQASHNQKFSIITENVASGFIKDSTCNGFLFKLKRMHTLSIYNFYLPQIPWIWVLFMLFMPFMLLLWYVVETYPVPSKHANHSGLYCYLFFYSVLCSAQQQGIPLITSNFILFKLYNTFKLLLACSGVCWSFSYWKLKKNFFVNKC